jgi:hypothetical protein
MLPVLTLWAAIRTDQGSSRLSRGWQLFFEPVEFHVKPADLLEQFRFSRLLSHSYLRAVDRFKKARDPGQQLLLPLLHLAGMNPKESPTAAPSSALGHLSELPWL